MSNNEQIETFNDTTPIIPQKVEVSAPVDTMQQAESKGVDTFEAGHVITEVPTNEPKAKEGKKPEIESLQEQDDQEAKTAKEKTDSEKADEAGKPEEKEEKPEVEAKPEDSKPRGKQVRFKNGDQVVDVDPDATVAVRVDGKKEFAPLKDVLASYSSEKSREKKYSQLVEREEAFKQTAEKFEQNKRVVVEKFQKIGKMIQDVYENPEADPTSALNYLVELSGNDMLKYEQRLMEFMVEKAAAYSEMDEVERKLFWKERENEILRNNQATRAKQLDEQKALEEKSKAVAQIREKYGVSEKDYVSAQKELVDLGYAKEQLTPESVCKYQAYKPYIEKAEVLAKQFEDDLDDDEMNQLVADTAEINFKYPQLSDVEALKIAAKKLGYQVEDYEESVQELEKKTMPPAKDRLADKKTPYKYGQNEGKIETFEDFDY